MLSDDFCLYVFEVMPKLIQNCDRMQASVNCCPFVYNTIYVHIRIDIHICIRSSSHMYIIYSPRISHDRIVCDSNNAQNTARIINKTVISYGM